ncbi:MAG: hypothetical protein KDD38_03070 [Bdellovibrionales bacterium]|nr:hypothetical protein [Bdellovibrionales bacterium]
MAVKNRLTNNSGTAMIETLPLLIIFVVLLSFGIGFFGVVHTGIMNSMAARTYAFETFSNRSDVTFFRDRRSDGIMLQYSAFQNRFHTVDSELNQDNRLGDATFATTRNIAFGRKIASSQASESDHNVNIYTIAGRNRKGGVEASPAWIMVGYGICINSKCGD